MKTNLRTTLASAALLSLALWPTLALAAPPTTCAETYNDVGCCSGGAAYFCNKGSTTVESMACGGGTVCGWNASGGFYDCEPSPGGADPSGAHPEACGGSGPVCGVTTGNATCDACLSSSCCSQGMACGADSTCVACLETHPACATNSTATALEQCLEARCLSACSGSSTSSSSSSGSTATSTSSSSGVTLALVGKGACAAGPGETERGLPWLVAGVAALLAAGRRKRRG